MRLLQILAVLATFFLVGCAHLPSISQTGLKPASPQSPSVELFQEISFPTRLGWRTAFAVGLAKGIYVPVLEDERGTYFKGPTDCVLITMREGGKLVDARDGGFWLPKNPAPNQLLKIYSYEFTGMEHRAREAANKPAAGSVAAATANQAAVSPPPGMSSVGAGVTAGVVTGVMMAIIEANKDSTNMILMTDELPNETLQSALRKRD